MKKVYTSPEAIEINITKIQTVLCGSPISGINGVGYGGEDNGTHDPSGRVCDFDFDDEEEL